MPHVFSLVLACVFLFGTPRPSSAQTDTDPFSKSFEVQKKLPTPAKVAAEPQPKVDRITESITKRIDFKAYIEPQKAKAGDIVRVTITGTPKPGQYTYPATVRAADQPDGSLSQIHIEAGPALKPLWPIAESKPEFGVNQLNEIILKHSKEFQWSQDLFVAADDPGLKKIVIKIKLMVCDKTSCSAYAFHPPLEQSVTLEPAAGIVAMSAELGKRLKMPRPEVRVEPIPADVRTSLQKDALATAKDAPQTNGAPKDLLGLLGAAFVGAFLMLLTPCVFPMIPITVNFFLKQSEREHHKPFLTASVYSGTIIFLLTIVMLALGGVVIRLANDPWFNLALGGVLIYFAFSLFGMYEVELPSGLARFTSSHEGQGGYMGAVFMALTFTITSFTCTGPFIGAMLGGFAGLRPPIHHLILAAVVYSATFAAPFFVLALFPSMLKKLPKSGGWLNSIKVTMGFLEIGAALKFLSNTDMALNPGNPRLFNYDTVLCAWIALSICCGLYLFGMFRLPHDDAVESIGVLRMIFGSIFLGLAIYMTPALFGSKPAGFVGENLVAFLPPSFKELPAHGNASSDHLVFHMDYIDAWKEATAEKKLIFIDFTGVNCTNCRDNEKNVFPVKDVQDQMKKYARVQLYTDGVPNKKLSFTESQEQARRNLMWQAAIAVGDLSNPTYILLEPDSKEPFDAQGNPKGKILGQETGKIFNIPGFVRFLEGPQKQLNSRAQADSPQAASN